MKKRLICVFFQGLYENDVKMSRNIARKSKNNEMQNFKKIDFLNLFSSGSMPPCIFYMFPTPEHPKNPIFDLFLLNIIIFLFFIILYRNGPRGPKTFFFRPPRSQNTPRPKIKPPWDQMGPPWPLRRPINFLL